MKSRAVSTISASFWFLQDDYVGPIKLCKLSLTFVFFPSGAFTQLASANCLHVWISNRSRFFFPFTITLFKLPFPNVVSFFCNVSLRLSKDLYFATALHFLSSKAVSISFSKERMSKAHVCGTVCLTSSLLESQNSFLLGRNMPSNSDFAHWKSL